MRIRCSGVEGADIEGELIGGGFIDPDTAEFDLEDTFTVRCDDGAVLKVHGWMVDVSVIEGKRPLVM